MTELIQQRWRRVHRVDISGLEENWMTGVVEMGWDSIPDVRKEE